MTKPAPAILRDVAALVRRRRLGGRAFAALVASTEARYRLEAPEAVARLAVVVRLLMPGATPAEVAELLEAEAGRLETMNP